MKGNRERVQRIDADGEIVAGGQERMRPKAIAIDGTRNVDELPRGQVIEVESGRHDVLLEEGGRVIACRVKRGASTENDESTLVVVGDFVRVQPLEGERGLIHHVEERRTHLGRNAAGQIGMEHVLAANVDLLICVVAADRPDFRRTIIDRYIVAALLGGMTPLIVLNKIDTVDGELEELLREEMDVYSAIGYGIFCTSAVTGDGVEELLCAIQDHSSVLIGQSGVGKSSLTNVIRGREERRTAEVREKDRRGTHTTISSAMLAVPGGGYLVDTPGLREFGIWDLEAEELDGYFVEFLDHLQSCRFKPCTHSHEPDCAVRAAVDAGCIDEGRYASYLAIFDSLKGVRRR
ncbi:MAG: ribosome small subunit-dependent GTPase A [Bacteroidetes bacterium]|nr:ribosome small subunit-dependent GTPase A [Bacteroidota bacterium]